MNLESSRRSLIAPAPEAVVAVDRAVSSRPERNGGVLATLGANCRMHFPSVLAEPTATAEASPVALTASCPAAGRAAPGLIRVALLGMIRLVVSGKGERLTTFHARKGSVLVVHHIDLLSVQCSNNWLLGCGDIQTEAIPSRRSVWKQGRNRRVNWGTKRRPLDSVCCR